MFGKKFTQIPIPDEYKDATKDTFRGLFQEVNGIDSPEKWTKKLITEYEDILAKIKKNEYNAPKVTPAPEPLRPPIHEEYGNIYANAISLKAKIDAEMLDDIVTETYALTLEDKDQPDLRKHATNMYKAVIDIARKVKTVETNLADLAHVHEQHATLVGHQKEFLPPPVKQASSFTLANASKYGLQAPAAAIVSGIAAPVGLAAGLVTAPVKYGIQGARGVMIARNDILYLINGDPLRHLKNVITRAQEYKTGEIPPPTIFEGFTDYDRGLFTELKAKSSDFDNDGKVQDVIRMYDKVTQIAGFPLQPKDLQAFRMGREAQAKQHTSHFSTSNETTKRNQALFNAKNKWEDNTVTGYGVRAVNATKKLFGFGKKGGYTRKRSNMHKTFRARAQKAK